jgi:Family of unknown function (DUF5906)/RepB DNA-primase from phage plasmid
MNPASTMTDLVSRETVREFVTTIAARAKAALNGMAKPGFLQISQLHPESEKLVPSHYKLDDVARMIDDAIAAASAGHNVYIEGRTIREDAASCNGRGKLEDVAGVFALVIDSDADKQMRWEPNGSTSPSMSVETSPGNFQYWYFFHDAIAAEIGQKLGERIRKAVNCDHNTGTITQPYRVAGTANYPNKKKRERGRITVPTHLVHSNPEALWTPEDIERAFQLPEEPLPEPPKPPRGGDEAGIPADTMRVIRDGPSASASNRDRSQTFWNVLVALKRLGFTVESTVNLFERYPNGIAKRYEGRLRQEVERVYNKLKKGSQHASESQEILAELNNDNCVVLDGGKTWVLRFEQVTHNLNGRRYSYRVPIYLRTGDFRTLYMNRRVDTGERLVELGQWWLKHPERRQYFGLVFEPGGQPVVDGKLNLWTGWGVEPKRGDWSLTREHIFKVVAARDDDVDAYIINWLAWAVQHPGQQPETAPVFLGKRGSGRGTLGNAMCRIFGNHALHISSPDHLTGKFNAHLRQCVFLFCDEAYTVADKKAEATLKRLITEPTINIEGKGKDVVTVPNHLHIMMASNEDWVVPAGEIERRFQVQEVANTHAQDVAWFKPLYDQLDAGGLEAMLFDLLRHDLRNWHPRQIVRTAALAAQQAESLSPFDAWWSELLHDGHLPAGDAAGQVISGDYQVRRGRTVENRKGLYEQARTSSPELKKKTDAAFGRYLGRRKCVRERISRQRGWQFPTLDLARAEWRTRFPDTVWDQPNVTSWEGERD